MHIKKRCEEGCGGSLTTESSFKKADPLGRVRLPAFAMKPEPRYSPEVRVLGSVAPADSRAAGTCEADRDHQALLARTASWFIL